MRELASTISFVLFVAIVAAVFGGPEAVGAWFGRLIHAFVLAATGT